MQFKLRAPYKPTGDQPEAIEKLVEGIKKVTGTRCCCATGTGKTLPSPTSSSNFNSRLW